MKKLLNILTTFSIVSVSGISLVSCIKNDDDKKNNGDKTIQIEKSNLEKTKDLLSKGITIKDVLPGKTIAEYIEHIEKENNEKINSDIEFIFNDEYENTVLQQNETNLVTLLKDGESSELVEFSLKFLDKASIVSEILRQAKAKIEDQPIAGIGLVATDNISNAIKDRIIELIKNQIINSDVKVEWSQESNLTSLVVNENNTGKVKISVQGDENSTFKIVDFSIIDIATSVKEANKQLVEATALKLQTMDVDVKNSINESRMLNDNDFKNKIEKILKDIINISRIEVNLKEENIALQAKANKISVKLSAGVDEEKFEKDDVVISLINVLSDEREKNNFILDKIKQELISVDGTSLNLNLLITDQKVWTSIKQEIRTAVGDDDYSKVTVLNTLNSSTMMQQVFNNQRRSNKRNKGSNNNGSTGSNNNGGTRSNNNGGTGSNNNGGTRSNNNGSTGSNNNGGTRSNNNGGTRSNNNGGTRSNNNGSTGSNNNGGTRSNNNGGTRSNNNGGTGSNNNGGTGSNNNETTRSENKNGQQTSEMNSNANNKNSKVVTLKSTRCIVMAYIKVGSGKDEVRSLVQVTFKNVKSS